MAFGQGTIQQSGPVTTGHVPAWQQNGVVQDGGSPNTPAANSLGLYDGPECPLGVNSSPGPGSNSSPYSQFTLCQTDAATTFKFYGINGEPTPGVYFDLGGTLYAFPFGNGIPVYVAGSVAAIQSAVQLQSFTLIYVLSYYQGGKKGGGIFNQVASCADDGGSCIHTSDGTPFQRPNLATNGTLDSATFGVYGDGVHDDSARLNVALAFAAANGIVRVAACGQTVVNSANPHVPDGIGLDLCGQAVGISPTANFTLASGIQGVLAMPSTHTVVLDGNNSALLNGNILRSDGPYAPTVFHPVTLRDALNETAAFAGTAVSTSGRANVLHNLAILGFGTAIASTGKGLTWDHVRIDATNGITVDGSRNIAQIDDVTISAILNHGFSESWEIDNIFGDGTGQYKVVVAALPADFQIKDGDTVYIDSAIGGGTQSAAGKWTASCGGAGMSCATVASGTDGCVTTATCQEVVLTGSTCALASGSGCAPLSATFTWISGYDSAGRSFLTLSSGSVANVAVGQTVSDGVVCIPAGTKVTDVWSTLGRVYLSQATICAEASATSVTFTDSAFGHSPRGLEVSAVQRAGTGIAITNSGGFTGNNFHSYTHDIEFHCGDGCSQTRLSNCSFGEDNSLSDEDNKTILVDGIHAGRDGRDLSLTNCVLGQHTTKVLFLASDSDHAIRIANSVIGPGSGRQTGTMFEVSSGGMALVNSSASVPGNALIADGTTYRIVYIDNDNGGQGYQIGDVLTGTGGTCTTEPQYTVDAIDLDGHIGNGDGHQTVQGVCSVWPANPIVTTGGHGTAAMLDTDGFVPAVVAASNNLLPRSDFYSQTFPDSNFYGSSNACVEGGAPYISRCNNDPSAKHFAGGVTIGGPTGGNEGAGTINAEHYFQNGAALATVANGMPSATVTNTGGTLNLTGATSAYVYPYRSAVNEDYFPASPSAGLTYCFISMNDYDIRLHFNGHTSKIGGEGDNQVDAWTIHVPPAGHTRNATWCFTWDTAYWRSQFSSQKSYEDQIPHTDQVLMHGQVQLSPNNGSSRMELYPHRGEGGIEQGSRMTKVPSGGLWTPYSFDTVSVKNYWYVKSTTLDVHISNVTASSGHPRLTLTSAQSWPTGAQVSVWTHSINGVPEANVSGELCTVISNVVCDLLNVTMTGTLTTSTNATLRQGIWLWPEDNTHPPSESSGIISDGNGGIYVGWSLIDGSHVPTETHNYFAPIDGVTGAVYSYGGVDGGARQAAAGDLSDGTTGSGHVVLDTAPTIASPTVTGTLTTTGHLISSGTALSCSDLAFGSGAGTSPTCTAVTGDDRHFRVSFTSGTTPGSAATIFTVTFKAAYGAAPTCFVVPETATASIKSTYAIPATTTLALSTGTAASLVGSTAYVWSAECLQ